MDYFRLLNLTSEPFSNSPDPDFFFQSDQHRACLQKLELALRLRRGLNVVIGQIGTGKTTLCRQLLRRLPDSEDFVPHLILDPAFASASDLLRTLVKTMTGRRPGENTGDTELKEIIKDYLFSMGVEENKTIVLVIDEGQKLPGPCLEQLRELLNYETNNFKLLQIVIFAQPEFEQAMARHPNFTDRINLLYLLGPLDFKNTKQMIDYRLKRAGCAGGWRSLFTLPAIRAIYRITGGYPRKIINLCHHCILGLIVKDAKRVDRSLVLATARRNLMPISPVLKAAPWLATGAVLAAALAVFLVVVPGAFRLEGRRIAKMIPTSAVSRPATRDPLPEAEPEAAIGSDAVKLPPDPPSVNESLSRPEPTGQTVAEAESHAGDLPASIGKIRVRRNDTLADLIGTVYGTFNPGLLKRVLDFNPDIRNPDTIRVGQQVSFPAVSVACDPPALEACWIKIANAPTLSTAVEMLERLARLNPVPLQLLVSWNQQRGLAYEILVRGYFESTGASDSTIDQLVTFPGQEPECITGWPRETVFFSNPYESPFRFTASYQPQSG